MVGSTRTLIPLFIIFLLLTTCGSADIGVGNNTSSVFTLHALTNLRQRLSPRLSVAAKA